MKKAQLVVRILLGVMLVVLGLNEFLHFLPMPPMAEPASEFMGALVKGGYILAIVGLVEISTGILLLINRFQPLALVIMFPVLLNAFLFHLFLDPAGIGAAALAIAMNVFLFYANKESYDSLLVTG